MSITYEVRENKALYDNKTLSEWLPTVIGDLVRTLNPVQIYVFGSIVRGQDGPDSDLDLLVIFDQINDATKVHALAIEARRAITAPVPCDVLVTDLASFETSRHKPWFIYQQIAQEGSLVYEREPAIAKELYMNPLRSSKPEDADKFLESAKEDLWYANLGKDEHWHGAAFHAQQVAEKALKALLITQGEGFPKTHDLVELVDRLPPEAASLFDRIALSELSPWAIQGRYPADMPSITKDVMERLLLTAKTTMDTAAELVRSAVVQRKQVHSEHKGRKRSL
ncbi:MAG: HEPN domain-containing protein [Ferrimicrobium sp.]